MRNKIFITLGVLLIIVAIIATFLFENNIVQNSQALGFNVLIAKTNIQEGTVIKNLNQANQLFTTRRIARADAVEGAIEVNAIDAKKAGGFLDFIKGIFIPYEPQISPRDLQGLVGKKVTTTLYKNQQVVSSYLSNDPIEYKNDERLYAIKTSYIDSVGAEINAGDYVDVWVYYGQGTPKAGHSEKVIGPLRVIKIKDANNAEIGPNQKMIPQVVIFKLNESQIAVLSQKQFEGELFLTKWGRTPAVETQQSNLVPSGNMAQQKQ